MKETSIQSSPASDIWRDNTGQPSPLGSLFPVQALKQAARRLADTRRGAGLQTRDLVAMLVSHTARQKRLAQPTARMRMTLPAHMGAIAVRITLDN